VYPISRTRRDLTDKPFKKFMDHPLNSDCYQTKFLFEKLKDEKEQAYGMNFVK
jgi:hypothetical protein